MVVMLMVCGSCAVVIGEGHGGMDYVMFDCLCLVGCVGLRIRVV